MQNIGYFAPWSRQNSWADRIAINNIRKANTPQSLAMKQQMIEKEDEKFARKFSTPHTSMYTGVKQVSATCISGCCCYHRCCSWRAALGGSMCKDLCL
jgi:hypothetical protein